MAGLSQAGAAAGTAIAPGIGTAIGGVLGGLADSFMGGGSSSAGYAPQDAHSAIYGDMGLDGSGWVVNFSGTQSATSSQATPGVLDSLGGVTGAGGIGGIPSKTLLIGAGVVLVLMLWKKSKSKK